jgi:hypothetical protein
MSSVLDKNKIKKHVFFLDVAWFVLNRIVNCRNNRCWCYEISLAAWEVPFR